MTPHPIEILVLIWAVGTAVRAPRVLKHRQAVTAGDPIALCDACRDERRDIHRQADIWESLGPAGRAFYVLGQSSGWWLNPLIQLARRAAGKADSTAGCSRKSCAARR